MTDVFAVLATGMVWTVAWINGSRLVVSSWMAFRVGVQDNAALVDLDSVGRWVGEKVEWLLEDVEVGVSHGGAGERCLRGPPCC